MAIAWAWIGVPGLLGTGYEDQLLSKLQIRAARPRGEEELKKRSLSPSLGEARALAEGSYSTAAFSSVKFKSLINRTGFWSLSIHDVLPESFETRTGKVVRPRGEKYKLKNKKSQAVNVSH